MRSSRLLLPLVLLTWAALWLGCCQNEKDQHPKTPASTRPADETPDSQPPAGHSVCKPEWFPGPPDISPETMTMQRVDPATGKLSDPEPMSGGLAKLNAQASLEQSRGLNGVGVKVHRVYPYSDMGVILEQYHETHYAIGVDVEFDIRPREGQRFDPDDLELVDGATGEVLGCAPQIERLSPKGEIRGWNDPMFEGSNRYRILFVYPAPRTATRVCLGYWGQRVLEKSVEVRGEGPVIPR